MDIKENLKLWRKLDYGGNIDPDEICLGLSVRLNKE